MNNKRVGMIGCLCWILLVVLRADGMFFGRSAISESDFFLTLFLLGLGLIIIQNELNVISKRISDFESKRNT